MRIYHKLIAIIKAFKDGARESRAWQLPTNWPHEKCPQNIFFVFLNTDYVFRVLGHGELDLIVFRKISASDS